MKDDKHAALNKPVGEAHRAIHAELHKALDELVADWIDSPGRPSISKNSVLELMQWSAEQTKEAE